MIRNENNLKLFDQSVNQKIKTSIYSKKAYIYNTYKVKYPTTIQLICKLDKSWKKYMMHSVLKNDITIYLKKKIGFHCRRYHCGKIYIRSFKVQNGKICLLFTCTFLFYWGQKYCVYVFRRLPVFYYNFFIYEITQLTGCVSTSIIKIHGTVAIVPK